MLTLQSALYLHVPFGGLTDLYFTSYCKLSIDTSSAHACLAHVLSALQLFYGQNLDHEGQSGATISAGTTVEVLAAGAPFMVKR